MKNALILLLLIASVTACNTNPTGFSLKYEIPGSHGKVLKINNYIGGEFVVRDSLLIDSLGENILTGSVDHPELMYLTLEGQRRPVRLFIENAEYHISGQWNEAVIESRSTVQKELNAYDAGLKIHQDRMSELYQQYRTANIENDEAGVDSLVLLLEETDKQINIYDSLYIAGHPDSYISMMALRNMFYRYDADELEYMLNMIGENARELEEYKYVADKLTSMKKVAVGQPYTDFGLENPEGGILNVSDVHNENVLLIDFWASWCGPCRVANPEIVELYQGYHDKGFDVLGVSLDRDRESWLQAIEADELTWHQISDLQFWNCAGAVLYGVSSLPHSVLIDKKGIIRAKNLEREELKSKVEELLGE